MMTIADILHNLGPIDPIVKHRRRRSVAQDRAANCKAWRTRRRMKAARQPDEAPLTATERFARLRSRR
jgi:hypothetical protein